MLVIVLLIVCLSANIEVMEFGLYYTVAQKTSKFIFVITSSNF